VTQPTQTQATQTTTTYAPQPGCTRAERGRAWAVHVFTTLGIVAAMLALRDVLTDHPDYAIAWMLLTLLIDGVDGPIARALEVEARVPRIDGFMLDLIIDYVTCVVVPACFMYEFRVVPQNNYGIAVLCVMVFTSAIWFARKDMMTEDNWFRGFPAAWNIMAPVMFLLEARTWIGSLITIGLSIMSLTNMPYPHIARARWMRKWTIAGATCWIGGVAIGMITWPHHYYFVRIMLDVGSAYFVLLAVLRVLHDRRVRRAAATA
jgi:phosphatidylcholine synthase